MNSTLDERRRDERGEVDVTIGGAEPRKAVRERDREQKREQHLHAR